VLFIVGVVGRSRLSPAQDVNKLVRVEWKAGYGANSAVQIQGKVACIKPGSPNAHRDLDAYRFQFLYSQAVSGTPIENEEFDPFPTLIDRSVGVPSWDFQNSFRQPSDPSKPLPW
jgi:hypothetical protein